LLLFSLHEERADSKQGLFLSPKPAIANNNPPFPSGQQISADQFSGPSTDFPNERKGFQGTLEMCGNCGVKQAPCLIQCGWWEFDIAESARFK
jgi:uncharacterized protein (DUF934 family)